VRDDRGRNFTQTNDESFVLFEAFGKLEGMETLKEPVICSESPRRHPVRPPAPSPLGQMPGPLKFLRLLRDGPIESFTRDHFELPIVISKTVLGPIAYVSAPSALRRVLVENASNYQRAAF
jgi:hypothetical protein